MTREPWLRRLTRRFPIDTKGAVQKVSAKGVSKTVASCVASAIESIQFPKPKSGFAKVRYAFEFSQADAQAP